MNSAPQGVKLFPDRLTRSGKKLERTPWRPWRLRGSPLLFFLLLTAMLLALPTPGALSAAYQLDVSGNRLSADFQDTPLSTIITGIGAKTGISFVFLGGGAASEYSRPFSAQYKSMPIRAVLEKLLSGFNCSFISDDKENIRQVFILGPKAAAGSGAQTRLPFVTAANSVPDIRQEPGADTTPEGMEIAKDVGMRITPGEGMQITPGERMKISQGEGMQITPGEGIQIAPGEGMKVTPGEGMVTTPGQGMEIGSPSAEEMSSNLSGNDSMNAASANTEEVAKDYTNNAQMKPGPPVHRTGRWSFPKIK